MKIYRSILAAALLPILSGCVIVTDSSDWDDYDGRASWKELQEDNRLYIADLRMGTTIDLVRADLGRPDFSEGYESNGEEIVILRYRTHHRHSDGETTRDETTPLVFVNGQLAGWGENVIQDYPIARYPAAG
ncbi:MAG: DUF3192 domain-containing protein [Pseudomonadota bacterium]